MAFCYSDYALIPDLGNMFVVTPMSTLAGLQPTQKYRVIDLLKEARIDVSDWKNFKGGKAKEAANPKYCYNWSFVQPHKVVAVCLWIKDIRQSGNQIYHDRNFRRRAGRGAARNAAAVWARRARQSDEDIQLAYREQLPVRVIVLDGLQRTVNDPHSKSSQVKKRLLDKARWAVTEYNFATGECLLVRGEKPVEPTVQQADDEVYGFEGTRRLAFILHRTRESRLRLAKLKETKQINNGRLICEVPNCGFEFSTKYGELGDGYAQVHHKRPLSDAPDEGMNVRMSELAVVCANCHVMIHRGGECRPIEGLIPI
jgi:hypothetical protein